MSGNRKEARESYVPIIRKEMAEFLKTILAIKNPLNILEIGTAVGYSAILMSENISPKARITTIENYDVRIPIARSNFVRAGKEDVIKLIEGDAAKVLKELDETYDFIFMDAAKSQYIAILPDVLRLLKTDGILITDNVLQEGEIVESRYAVTRRNRTIYERMREYIYAVTHSPELVTSIIPIGDGITLSIKNRCDMRKLELLIPASSLEVLKTAVIFGADAVYIGGEAFGLRAKARNFTIEEMAEGVVFAHEHDVKVYVTANILAHNYDLDKARKYFIELREKYTLMPSLYRTPVCFP